jgi:hypothetical protein
MFVPSLSWRMIVSMEKWRKHGGLGTEESFDEPAVNQHPF